jgi:hypothetical protein
VRVWLLTKLKTIHSTYQLECDKEMLKVMGGQGRDESHFVEHEYLEAADYKFTVMEHTCFLPQYDDTLGFNKASRQMEINLCVVASFFLTLFCTT